MFTSTKSTLRISSAVAAASLFAMGLTHAAHAAPATFAQFHEAADSDGANLFSYVDTDPSTGTPFGALVSDPSESAGIPVTFTFLNIPGLPADLQGVQDATLTLTSTTTSAVQTSFGGTVLEEDIDGASNVLTITRDTPAAEGSGARTNLLTLDFTGQLIGLMNSHTPQLSGDTNQSDTVVYSSDFVGFAAAAEDYSLSFSSWMTNDSANGLVVDAGDNLFQSATAAGVGTFDATVVIPEPSSLGLAGLLLILGRRNRISKLI